MPSRCVPKNRVRGLRVVRKARIGARRRETPVRIGKIATFTADVRRVHYKTDNTQQVVWRVETDPFGNEIGSSIKTVENNLRFPGQYYDQESGLNQNYFRDYDPALGRYVEADPIGIKGGLNLFRYANNSPINSIDPTGLIEAGYGGWEFQFVIGYGRSTVTCCDGKNLRKLTYAKYCLGAGFTAGVSSGAAFNSQGISCKNPPSTFWTGEFGIPIFGAFGVEGGVAVTNNGSTSPFIGGTGGAGGKATMCWYELKSNESVGCCK